MTWILALLACVPDRDCVRVRHDGADLPLCVEGNQDSDHILLHLPGGPSNVGGWLYTRYGVRQELKKDFLVASTDYRGTGASTGHYRADRLTVDQLASDVNELVRVLHLQYPDRQVWLHGHSFGGLVGAAALLQAPQADGWVSEAGCHDPALNAPLSHERLLAYVPRSADPDVRLAWSTLQDAVAELDPSTFDGHVELNGYANEANDLLALDRVDNATQGTLVWATAMPFQLAQTGLPGNQMGARLTEDSYRSNLQARLGAVDVPSLFLAGTLDFICTREHVEAGAAAVGTERVEVVVFEGGGHDFGDQFPVEVADEIRSFVLGEN